MNKASWGTKRNCPACSTGFYDLNHHPAVCPKCKNAFDPAVAVRSKRKTAKRSADEGRATVLSPQALVAARKAAAGKKQKKAAGEEDGGDNIGLMEMDEVDDIESLHELSELEEMEEEIVNEDDADEEALIEDLDTAGNVIVGNPEDEEAVVFVKEAEDEEPGVSSKKKKSKK